MLILSRQREERIMIGDDIIITIVEIRGDKVRIGIDCPKHTPVHREEVYKAIHREVEKRIQTGPIPTFCKNCDSSNVRPSSMRKGEVICNDCGDYTKIIVNPA